MKVTQVAICPSEASEKAARPALTPELLAASGARYSRNNEGLEAILSKIDPNNPVSPRPDGTWGGGDGRFGVLEGFSSQIGFDGQQPARWWLRSDCNGETSLAFALRAEGYRVVPLPGPSAVVAALSASGLPADRFVFLGFLPRKGSERARLLAQVTRQGYVDGYRGMRIAKSGGRFMIADGTVWNLVDENGQRHGQAAVFVPQQ